MPNIPYPEFEDFRLTLDTKDIAGDEPISGIAKLHMKDMPNCVKDILIACRCVFRHPSESGGAENSLIFEEVSRNATPFDDDGIPAGEYEFPFSFNVDPNLPPSMNVVGGWENTSHYKIWYEIRAYVMHAESHPTLERKHLRTSAKFLRRAKYKPSLELAPHVQKRKEFSWKTLDMRLELDKDVYVKGEPIHVSIIVKNELLRNVSAVKVLLKQHISIYIKDNLVGSEYTTTCGHGEVSNKFLPIKRQQTFNRRVSVSPKLSKEDYNSGYHFSALTGHIDQTKEPEICATSKRTASNGIEVSYSVQVRFSVALASDVLLSIPFILSDTVNDAKAPPTYIAAKEFASPGDRKAAEAQYEEERANAWLRPPDTAHPDDLEDEELGDLPSYNETMTQKSVFKKMRASQVGFAKQINMKTSKMFSGSTDLLASHDLEGDDGEEERHVANRTHSQPPALETLTEAPSSSTLDEPSTQASLAVDIISADFVRRLSMTENRTTFSISENNGAPSSSSDVPDSSYPVKNSLNATMSAASQSSQSSQMDIADALLTKEQKKNKQRPVSASMAVRQEISDHTESRDVLGHKHGEGEDEDEGEDLGTNEQAEEDDDDDLPSRDITSRDR